MDAPCLKINERKTAILVVDTFQGRKPNFFRKLNPFFLNEERAKGNICRLLESNKRLPVLLVSSNFDGVAYGLDKRVVDAAGTDAKIIVKERDDAFDGTGLKKLLHGMRVDTLILCGYNSACCVLKTAKSAFGEFSIITSPKAMYYPPWGEVRKFYETYTMHLQLEDVVRLLQGNKEKPDSE